MCLLSYSCIVIIQVNNSSFAAQVDSVSHLEVDPGLQLSAAVKQTQQAGAGDAVSVARHEATPTRRPTERTVLMVA